MSYKLFLDDIRHPHQVASYMPSLAKIFLEPNWVVVRNYADFVAVIMKRGVPAVVSFDHDLADEHYTPESYWSDYEASKAYQDAKQYREKTGHDAAHWLCQYLERDNLPLPVCYVHSMNPVGADKIRARLAAHG